ncbi:MAG: ATP/cobalamin adenosyltransferase [Candidatus Daviesbacteria bacterium GW2011_GWA1_41_61]|uniref:ATP/cobalamin adenosyltransferase n=1 Tax=Candidatus Daviesbacteria bacterium GW2011_GWA2_40_9 TaxID=1618424 RepID=A0A0G0U243_9BACT|nr:MAG: ATP/cobalamin adenosyltransferase [Candidatus Daviesbacteria bacterium GW2011_GWC1_40_9]KKR83159.1 MAG: ATP/cobalamin adenosyltransferase [Candidatus Daviesbacteria bacterium GW2011_GWA2_40_9]KKR93506.1 MAG: ATP/cobalamin adenosyltransferase [Candidatus Daviesbacteria bacterium GW2011_GWB1_41_15]KKS14945.1 MAG: ATP/cobalamin adenosyltransferase [Candidatus Daviesbacteria bacterium GW2011_GWA1_41_61]
MDFSKAKKVIEAAEAKAEELGIAISTAIVDEYGDLVAFSRMKGAIKISPKFALAKAYTAGTIGMATVDMAPYAVPGKPYYGMDALFGGELTTIAGGLPIKAGDKLIGGIGVGGSADVTQDVECAQAALKALE